MTRRAMIRLATGLLIGAAGSVAALTRPSDLPVFIDAATGETLTWQSSQDRRINARPRVDGEAPGIRLYARLSAAGDRITWDRPIEADLTAATGIGMRLRVRRPEAVRSITLYLRSGDGWYAASIRDFSPDWQSAHWNRDAFETEGTPAGWGSISAVRIAVWRGDGSDTTVELAGLRSHVHRILVIRNDSHARAEPADAWTVNHYAKLAAEWLAGAGIPASIVSDRRVSAEGIPAGARIAILPFNPALDAAQAGALTAFVRRGGSIIVSYTLPEPLAPLLGVKHKQWLAAPRPDGLATIKITASAEAGFPDRIRQDSWNATVATTTTARVIGTWVDGDGHDSGIPAMTLGSGGAFIGHVLTNRDRDRKTRLLTALIAALQPALQPALAEAMLAQADRFLHLDSRDNIHAFLLDEARRNRTTDRTQRDIESIDAHRARTRDMLDTAPFGELLDRIAVSRRMTATAYLATQPAFIRAGEWRGIWAHEPDGLPGLDWDAVAGRIAGYGITALLPNLLWPGRAFYPTPVFDGIAGAGGGPDRLTEVLAAANRHGLELHLWKVCWNLQRAPAAWVADLRAAGRLQVSHTGEPINWLCPSHPDNRAIEQAAIVDAARRYPVDGIHLDYIRYPGAHACFCDGCRERFAASDDIAIDDWPADVRAGGPQAGAWQDWRRRQITSWLTAVRRALQAEQPDLKLSAAVFPSVNESRHGIGQDWARWIADDLLDFVTPMSYTTGAAEFQRFLDAQLPLATDQIPIYPGIGVSSPGLPVEQTARQIDLLRRAGAPGFILFQLDTDTLQHTLPALTRDLPITSF